MKIISIVTSFPRNENDVLIPWIIRLIKELKFNDVETDVFTSSYCGLHDESKDGIKVRRFRYFFKRWENLSHDMSVPEKLKSDKRYFLVLPFFMFFGMIAGYRYGRKNDFDIIHVHFPFPLALFGIAMKIASKKPMIVSCHGSEVNMAKKNRVFRAIFRWMMKRADIITVNSTFMQKEVTKIVTNCGNIEIIPMGSGIGEFKLGKRVKKRGGDSNKIKILFVGRLIKLKGVEYLIEAFKILGSENYELHIVGDGPEKENNNSPNPLRRGKRSTGAFPLSASVKKRGIRQLPLFVKERAGGELFNRETKKPAKDDKVVVRPFFHGYLTGTALEEMYRVADVFVLPSIVDDEGYSEGLGTVLLEALSYGVPVIGTDTGGIPDIVIDGVTGLLVPQKDPHAIANAIEKIVSDAELSKKLTLNGKEHFNKNFSWKVITERFHKAYMELFPS